MSGIITQKIYLKLSNNRVWMISYNTVCAIFFIPFTAYMSYKLKKIRLARKERLERERKIQELQKLYRILRMTGSSFSSIVLLKIISLRGGDDVIIPGVVDCVEISQPSYIDNERILRYLNDKFPKLNIGGIIYITKQALCYLAKEEGLVDFPLVFLERIKIDGVYSFIKTASEWAVLSIGVVVGVAGYLQPHIAFVTAGYA